MKMSEKIFGLVVVKSVAILMAVLVTAVVGCIALTGCSSTETSKTQEESTQSLDPQATNVDGSLASNLPSPADILGADCDVQIVEDNSDNYLAYVNDADYDMYLQYVQACKYEGFVYDEFNQDSIYRANNSDENLQVMVTFNDQGDKFFQISLVRF